MFARANHRQKDIAIMKDRTTQTRHLTRHGLFGVYASRAVLRMYLRWGASSFVILGSLSLAAVAL